MYAFQTLPAATARARILARKKRQPVAVMFMGGTYECWTDSEIEHAFAAGDMTEHEFNRDYVKTVRG